MDRVFVNKKIKIHKDIKMVINPAKMLDFQKKKYLITRIQLTLIKNRREP